MKTSILATISVLLFGSAIADADQYVIAVSRATSESPQWSRVVDALVAKHEGATVVIYNKHVRDSLIELRERHPRYTCFVATPAEAGRQFVADIHRLTRRYDDDPYTDTLWGILTGFDAANALEIAQHQKPLVVHKVASGTEIALEMCSQGMWYDELVKQRKVVKIAGGDAEIVRGPADTTHAIAETLTEYAADLFVTSGHATARDWQIGFRYRNGQFRSKNGQMFGVPIKGDTFAIHSDTPKVYLPIGNCLMGHIDGPDAMALAWMNSVGVRQMIGYTVVTWYGYAGWGVLDYFVEQPGRYTFAEAFHVNQHALVHRLDRYFEDAAGGEVSLEFGRRTSASPNEFGRALGLTAHDGQGLLWDRDTVALYGDPAWTARMAPQAKWYDQELTIDHGTYTFTITPKRGEHSFDPVNVNGSQRGWRPIVELLPHRVSDMKIIAGADLAPVVTDDFILVPNPRVCDESRTYRVIFTASRID